jgi:hypothetical protein
MHAAERFHILRYMFISTPLDRCGGRRLVECKVTPDFDGAGRGVPENISFGLKSVTEKAACFATRLKIGVGSFDGTGGAGCTERAYMRKVRRGPEPMFVGSIIAR